MFVVLFTFDLLTFGVTLQSRKPGKDFTVTYFHELHLFFTLIGL